MYDGLIINRFNLFAWIQAWIDAQNESSRNYLNCADELVFFEFDGASQTGKKRYKGITLDITSILAGSIGQPLQISDSD